MEGSAVTHASTEAHREKHWVALTSVLAAVLLTGSKLIVGLMTQSLGILAEAAHSGLDLVAAVVTLWAVNVSAKPADRNHPYGHGKVENLSALFETVLLLATCGWIIYEAVHRLLVQDTQVEVTPWSFVVVIVSIVVDMGRSRALQRAAEKYDSHALEADALHFATDIWSSAVVFVGLLGVLAAQKFGMPALIRADAIAALGVAAIVVWVSMKLGKKSVDDLLDAAPPDIQEKITRTVAAVPGVESIRQVRVRKSGAEVFADITISVGRAAAFEKAHAISEQAEAALRAVIPKADATIHVEPVAQGSEDLFTTVRVIAARQGVGAHAIRVYEEDGQRALELHLEVDELLSLQQAHDEATQLERTLRVALPEISRVDTHIEPIGISESILSAHTTYEGDVQKLLQEYFARSPIRVRPHNVRVRMSGQQMMVLCHCAVDAAIGISEAHRITEGLEKFLRSQMPQLGRALIHVEPERRRNADSGTV